jgi:hypothetical protein
MTSTKRQNLCFNLTKMAALYLLGFAHPMLEASSHALFEYFVEKQNYILQN